MSVTYYNEGIVVCGNHMTKPKKPPATFEILLKGDGIYPENVPARTLSSVIGAVQKLAEGEDTVESTIRLLDIKRGSAKYSVVTDEASLVLRNLSNASQVASDPESQSLRFYMLSAFRQLSRIAAKMECEVEFRTPEGVWSITADSYAKLSGSAIVQDEVVVSGKLVRVGGATERKCSLRVNGRDRLLYCKIETTNLSRLLGRHLYRDVVLTGTGRRFAKTWELLSLHVHSAAFPNVKRGGGFAQFFKEMREIAGTGWDVDDISKELEGLR